MQGKAGCVAARQGGGLRFDPATEPTEACTAAQLAYQKQNNRMSTHRWDSPGPGCGDDDDSDEEALGHSGAKAKPRRKSHQRPQVGSSAGSACFDCAGARLSRQTNQTLQLPCPPLPGSQGSDQIRQAFSKRKKGLVLKAFQLNSLTDAKVWGRNCC